MKTKIIPVETAIVASLLCLALTTQAGSITASNTANVSIPEAGGGAVSSTITITNAPAVKFITGIDVYFRCIHTYSGDLTVDLRADPAGNLGSYRLWNREGGSADNPTRTTTGISRFNMLSPNRTWYLVVQDWAGGDTGYIDEWTITIYYTNRIPAATYCGLFGDGDYTNSGPVTLSTTREAKFSAKLELTGKKYHFSGAIGTNGTCSRVLPRKGLSDLQVYLDFRTDGQVTGQVSDGSWTSALEGFRNSFNKANPAPQQGKYTMCIPFSSGDPSVSPHGVGFGSVRVNSLGKVKFAGKLPDGTTLVQTSSLSDAGDWPFYRALYGRKGCAMGWLTVTNANSAIDGSMVWHRPPMPRAKLYPNGIDIDTDNVLGSSYIRPAAGDAALNLTNVLVQLGYGNLTEIASVPLYQERNNHFVQTSASGDYKLKLSIIPSSGLVKGSFIHPVTGKTIALRGALLQDRNEGGGYFIGPDESGAFEFGDFR